MSSPSGKSFDPFDLSPYAPKRARERTASDENKDNANVVLPYAPRTALPGMEASEPESADKESHASASAPVAPTADTHADPETALEASGIHQTPAAPEVTDAGSPEPAADEIANDPDLQRLEASLQWIQREGTASRLPRAASLPPVSGLRPVGPEGLRPRGEQFINGIRVPPSLAPERLRPPPMRERRENLRGPVRVLLASLIAAPIAYYFSVGTFSSNKETNHDAGSLTSLASRLVASTEFPIPKDKLPPAQADDYNTMVSSRNKLVEAPPAVPATKVAPVHTEPTAPAPVAIAPPPPAVEQPAAPAPASAPASKAVREMDPQQIKLLMQQGEQFLAAGDVLTARTVFQRAAEGGNAAAALALGATYDPDVLSKMGARGVSPDIEKARMWYERAKDFGSPDAPRRLESLATRK